MLNAERVSADSLFLEHFKAVAFLARGFKFWEKPQDPLEKKAIDFKCTFNIIASDFKEAAC